MAPQAFRDGLPAVRKLFDELERTLVDGSADFTLESHGPIIVLELDDDLRDLRAAHLSEGLFDTVPEEVVELTVGGRVLYRVMVLCNNEFMPVLFIPKELVDRYPEGKAYLERWI